MFDFSNDNVLSVDPSLTKITSVSELLLYKADSSSIK